MITAGSVRGNWRRSQRVHRSSCPAASDSSDPPQRGQNRVAKCHSAKPIAWKRSGAASGWSARSVSRARSGTQSSLSPGASRGSTRQAAYVVPSSWPSSTRVPSGTSPGEDHSTPPSTGRSRLPATTSTRVAGSAHCSASHASSVRRRPSRLCAWRESATCGSCGSVT